MGGWVDGQGEDTADPMWNLSLSRSLSYITHMIHVEPRGAGITLTFRIQHTHTHMHSLPIPRKCVLKSPAHVLSVLYLYVCANVSHCVCVCAAHTVVVVCCTQRFGESVYQKTDPVSTTFVAVAALCRDKCAPSSTHNAPVPLRLPVH